VPIRRDAPLALGGVALARGVNRPAAGGDGWGRGDGEGGGRGGGAGVMWIGRSILRTAGEQRGSAQVGSGRPTTAGARCAGSAGAGALRMSHGTT